MRPPAAAYCRVTVLAPRTRCDVALPADVPVAELVPMVLELVGEPLFGVRPQPWRLLGIGGGPLPPGSSLDELGVLDGELLRIAPDGHVPPPPVFDDPVDALAVAAGRGGPGDPRLRSAAALLAAAAAAALLAATPPGAPGGTGPGSPGWATGVAALAVAAAVGLVVRLVRRAAAAAGDGAGAAGHRLAAVTVAVAAVPLAAAGGWAALPGAPVSVRVLLVAAAAGGAAATVQVALRVVAPGLVAVVTVAPPVAAGALAVLRFGVPPAAAAAAVGALALTVGPLLPRAALRLAGLPRPVVPADGGELVDADDDLLPPDELAERADLARGHLAGLVGGCAAVAAGAAPLAATAGGWAGPAFAAVTVAVLGLRCRGFADAAPARTVGGCAVAAGVGLVAVLALPGGAPTRLVAAVALVLAAGVGALAVGRTRPTASPVVRRAVDLGEALLTAASIPLAVAVLDLFRLLRGL